MSLQDPRLAWTVFLAPRDPHAVQAPPWPALVGEHFGPVELAAIDPVGRLLEGPFPVRVLARLDADGAHWILSGLGRAIGVTVSLGLDSVKGDAPSTEVLRAEALRRLVRGDELDSAADDSARLEALRASLAAADAWDFLGICEVVTALAEGVSPDLPDDEGWCDLDSLHVGRGTGMGEGHVAWTQLGYYSTPSERSVMEQRLRVFREGHRERVPSFVAFGLEALVWGAAAGRAVRRAAALDSVLDEVRMAASWAVSGGPHPGLEPQTYPALAARLETLRVGLQEEIYGLKSGLPRLAATAVRILGEGRAISPTGPLVEASPRAADMLASLESRETVAARWSGALDIARQALPT